MVDELHLKLRKIENSCDENAIIGRASNVASTSPVTSTNSKFYKNLKKIKRNHGAENPTKNYYLAFPALSSKKTTTITSGGCKPSPSGGVDETKQDSNLQLLCWSNLMSSAKENSLATSSTALDGEKLGRKRRQRRYGRHLNKGFSRSDVQCNAKSYEVHEGAASFSPKVKIGSKKHQRNQFGKSMTRFELGEFLICILPAVTSKSQAKSCVGARNINYPSTHDAPKMGSSQWDMDFKGHWEMDRDLIGEFIQQQQPPRGDAHPVGAKSTNQVELAMDEEEDDVKMLMKFLPMKLMEDEIDGVVAPKAREAQSISSLKSKFDDNVKALWDDVDDPLTKPLTQKNFDDDGNASLASSFASEQNSFGLFNFCGHQPRSMEVIAPCTNLQMFSSTGTEFTSLSDYDCNNNGGGGRGAIMRSQHSSSTVSPGAEKFIKSGTNLQTSIWSDGEFACEPESLIYKDVSIAQAHTHEVLDAPSRS